jgi:ferredoxin--NADP+ reductase
VSDLNYYVAVIGAGPAGMFAARELARSGARVVIFNRDIKPGGLAEYGIYPDRHAMKEGLRSQFRQVLDTPGVTYLGNVTVGHAGDFTLDELRGVGFQAFLVTVGAQGTKWLGLPGESLTGVYHAKDIVFHYNQLPPYSKKPYHFGEKVILVGAGNVMLDVTRFLIQKVKVNEILAIARRGPAEVKFDKKEMEYVIRNLDLRSLDEEMARVTPMMHSIGQNPDEARENILEALPKAQPSSAMTRFHFRFLASPVQIIGNEKNQVVGFEIEENELYLANGLVKASGTGHKLILPADSVVFAIGDKVDERFGLPVASSEFVKNPKPRFPIDDISYEAYAPDAGHVIEDVFVAGWARKASNGLVGMARKDGTYAAKALLQYLQTLQPVQVDDAPLGSLLRKLSKPVITTADIRNLRAIEEQEAQRRGVESFKFSTNEEMLEKIMSVG